MAAAPGGIPGAGMLHPGWELGICAGNSLWFCCFPPLGEPLGCCCCCHKAPPALWWLFQGMSEAPSQTGKKQKPLVGVLRTPILQFHPQAAGLGQGWTFGAPGHVRSLWWVGMCSANPFLKGGIPTAASEPEHQGWGIFRLVSLQCDFSKKRMFFLAKWAGKGLGGEPESCLCHCDPSPRPLSGPSLCLLIFFLPLNTCPAGTGRSPWELSCYSSLKYRLWVQALPFPDHNNHQRILEHQNIKHRQDRKLFGFARSFIE